MMGTCMMGFVQGTHLWDVARVVSQDEMSIGVSLMIKFATRGRTQKVPYFSSFKMLYGNATDTM